jgi:uncharacterized protein YbjT (DUF2867 family)
MKKMLIVGASGVLGRAAAIHFLQKGYAVSAFVRDPGKVRDLEGLGAQVIKGDLTDPTGFSGALQGVDIVLAAAHALMGRGRNSSEQVDLQGHRAFIDTAKAAGVDHFIYTSATFASQDAALDFSRTKYAVEQYLAKSGLSYTILRPTAFMEWHAYRLLGQKIMETGKVSILGSGRAKVNFIAVQDVVSAIEQVIDSRQYRNQVIELAGPDTLSRNEVAERFGRATGKPFKVGHVPLSVVRFLRGLFKPFHPGLARVMEFTILTEDRDDVIPPGHTIAQFGLPPTTIDNFIQQVIHRS